MDKKQSSDHMNSNKVAGSGVTSVKPKDSSASKVPGYGQASGSSQSEKRGPQGNG